MSANASLFFKHEFIKKYQKYIKKLNKNHWVSSVTRSLSPFRYTVGFIWGRGYLLWFSLCSCSARSMVDNRKSRTESDSLDWEPSERGADWRRIGPEDDVVDKMDPVEFLEPWLVNVVSSWESARGWRRVEGTEWTKSKLSGFKLTVPYTLSKVAGLTDL